MKLTRIKCAYFTVEESWQALSKRQTDSERERETDNLLPANETSCLRLLIPPSPDPPLVSCDMGRPWAMSSSEATRLIVLTALISLIPKTDTV